MMRRTAILVLAVSALAPTGTATAQALRSEAPSVGFAESYGSRARGFEAAFWNPANLGMSDGPGWSIGLPAAAGFVANNSLSYGQIADLYGEFLDDQTKSEILAEVREEDPGRRFELAADAGVRWVGFSLGRFAIHASTRGTAVARMSPDALELLLFGNVGEDGTGKDFDLAGSEGLAWATTGGSLSYGHPFTVPALDWLDMKFAAGLTVHYIHAHGLAHLEDRGSQLTVDPLAAEIQTEMIRTRDPSSGSGWAVDAGAAMEWGPWTAVLSVQNALGDIAWTAEDIEVRRYSATADFDSARSEEVVLDFSELSAADQERVSAFLEEADFPTRIRLGGAYGLGSRLSISMDYEEVVGGLLHAGWDRSLGVGAELRPVGFLPLRAGLATSFGDFAYAGGFGIHTGPVHLDLSLSRRGLPGGDGLEMAAALSIWGSDRR